MTDAAFAKSRAIARIREALRVDATQARGPTEARGESEWCGARATWKRTTDEEGNVTLAIESAALSRSTGVRGGVGWEVDESGASNVLELANLEELIVTSAVADGRWLLEGTELAVEVASIDASAIVLLLSASADAVIRYRLTIDGTTFLPRRLERVGREDAFVRYEDWMPGPFGLVPRRTIAREAWLEDVFVTHAIERIAALPDAPSTTSAAASWTEHPLEQRTTRRRLPLVRARVDDAAAGWFLLDTGAGSLAIDASEAPNLPAVGRRLVRTSTDQVGATLRRGRSLHVGPLTMPSPLYLELELSPFGGALGVRLAGVLGYDLFRNAVVAIDGDRVELLRDAPALDDWVPLRFEDRRPAIALRFPGIEGEAEGLFALDTGSATAITIHSGAAPLLSLRGGARASLRGIGSSTGSARARTLAWVELAGQRFEDIDAIVAGSGAGVTGEIQAARTGRGIMGSIGMGLLSDVTTVLDYARRRASFRRRKRAALRAPLR